MKYSKKNICPKCGEPMDKYTATSRRIHHMQICSTCGMREALEDMKMPESEIKKILTAKRQLESKED